MAKKKPKLTDRFVLPTREMTPEQLRQHLNRAHAARRIPAKNLSLIHI